METLNESDVLTDGIVHTEQKEMRYNMWMHHAMTGPIIFYSVLKFLVKLNAMTVTHMKR